MPLAWSELDQESRPVFHVADFEDWRERLKRDPWKALPQSKQKIDPDKVQKVLQAT
jgi:bifunctional non-homologous end joining protein LigD